MVLFNIYNKLLKLIYYCLKFLPIKNKQIVFFSNQYNTSAIDIIYLVYDINIRYKDWNVKIFTKRKSKNIFSSLIYMIDQLYFLATSRICVVDGCDSFVSYFKHKSDLRIIYLGCSLEGIKDYKIANVYDYVVCPSRILVSYLDKKFNISSYKCKIFSLPRIDYLIKTEKDNKNNVYKKYSCLKYKKVILYVVSLDNDNYKFNELIKKFSSSKYQFIIKTNSNIKMDDKYTFNKCNYLELLSVSDYVISDSLSISIEASALEKKVVLYKCDLNNILENELPVFNSIDDLYDFIKNGKYDLDVIRNFKKKYVNDFSGNCTNKLTDFILKVSN